MHRTLMLTLLAACATPALGQTPQAPSPAATGAHTVVKDTLTGLARPDGKASELAIHRPLDASVPRPVVLFVHGWSAHPDHYRGLIENLASRGFVVAAFDQIDTYELDLELWRRAAASALDALTAAAADPQSPLFGALDLDRLAVMGHSYGGSTTLALAATDPRVKVAVALTPGCDRRYRDQLLELAGRVRVPTLIVGGEFDPVTPVRLFARPAFELLPASERLYVELARTEHVALTDYDFGYYVFRVRYGGWVRTMRAEQVRLLSRSYANAWIEHHLGVRTDTQGYVDGQAAAADEHAGNLSRYRR